MKSWYWKIKMRMYTTLELTKQSRTISYVIEKQGRVKAQLDLILDNRADVATIQYKKITTGGTYISPFSYESIDKATLIADFISNEMTTLAQKEVPLILSIADFVNLISEKNNELS